MAGQEEAFLAGTTGKSDCVVRYAPSDRPLSVHVESSVLALFGRAIESSARAIASALGVACGELEIRDDGALAYVIEARVEAALRSACGPVLPSLARPARPDSIPERSRRDRRRWSRLYLPGNQPDFVVNAGLFGADCLVLDLEDSVAPDRKAEARILVRRTLESCRSFFGQAEVAVRLNPLSGPYGREDLAEFALAPPDAVILPKCERPSDVEALDVELASLESSAGLPQGSILVMPLIETALGAVNAAAIAAASARNAALCFGAEDFARDLGVRRTPSGEESLVARMSVVLGAKSAGIQAQDSVFSDVDDEVGLAASCVQARALGFSGKGLVHPRQIGVAHRAFAPAEAEFEEAERIVAALAAAEAAGLGVASLNGKMIDAPVAARARSLVDAARLRREGA